jgi:hypothetical protein
MIWVEILSRHRDIAARFRIAAPEARIGRGYDNDVIIDDPYVAAQHLRVFRDEAGQLVAEDLGSANGTFPDGGRNRLARIVIDGKHPIRIGQTYLRVRDIHHEVERERVAPPEWRALPIAAAAALGASLLGLSALQIWLAQTAELRASSYLTPLLTIVATVLVWAGIWALLSRIFSGSSHLLRNLLITLAGGLAFSLYHEFARVSAFAWTWSGASTYQYVATWSILAAVCFLHLREVGRTRLKLKGAIVVARYCDRAPGLAAVRGFFRLRAAVHDAPADAACVPCGPAHRTKRFLWRNRQSQNQARQRSCECQAKRGGPVVDCSAGGRLGVRSQVRSRSRLRSRRWRA